MLSNLRYILRSLIKWARPQEYFHFVTPSANKNWAQNENSLQIQRD